MLATTIALQTIVTNTTRNNNRHNYTTSNSYKKEERVERIPNFVFDVMASKYSKKVIKTYKTRRGAENYIAKNGLNTVVKARIESYREVRF